MENIAPPLKLLWSVKKSLEKGNGPKLGIMAYLGSDKDNWQPEVQRWMSRLQQGHSTENIKNMQKNSIRQQIFIVLERGLRGESILNQIQQLEDEVNFQVELEFQKKIDTLPFLMLIPLAFLFFPSCAILLIGPLVISFLGSF